LRSTRARGRRLLPFPPCPPIRTQTGVPCWSTRRHRYNVALVASGVVAGIAFFAVLIAREVWPPPPGEYAHADFEMLSLIGGPIAFAIGVGLANLCYSLGARVELLLRPRNPESFRHRAFSLGLAFSVALPWIIPVNAWCEFFTIHLRR
jgi:hypothetical protein